MTHSFINTGFSPTVTEQELRNLFSDRGAVLSVQIETTVEGQSLGFAKVEMAQADAAEQAIQTLHHVQLDGCILLVYRGTQVSSNGGSKPQAT